jgi:hypothetical protein
VETSVLVILKTFVINYFLTTPDSPPLLLLHEEGL